MKKESLGVAEENYIVLPEYGMQKIMQCADAYRNIANTYLSFHKEFSRKPVATRGEKLHQRQVVDNQNFMAEQFLYMADKLSHVATKSYQFVPEADKQFKQLYRHLKKEGIEMKHLYFMENENRDGVLEITMRSLAGKGRRPVTDVAESLCLYYDMRLRASVQSAYFVEEYYQSFTFVQEPEYMVLSGEACATKTGESISGDSILISDGIDGHIFFMLADGVGSGVKASLHSERVLEFMEKFLEAGYTKETAIQVLNGILLQDGEETSMSTLDICDIDLYKGVCEFHKIGGALSFHKREHLVEKISIDNLPLGAFHTLDLDVVRTRMEEGDYIIMVTDGIMEGLAEYDAEDKFVDYISAITLKNPRDMAQHILQNCISLCKGKIQDDLTVLVFGMWRN